MTLSVSLTMAPRHRSNEKDFQKAVEKILGARGWRAFHLEPKSYPGFFDIQAVRGHIAIYAELKDITKQSQERPLFQFFEETQPAFYLDWLLGGGSPFWVLVDCKETVIALLISKTDQILDWWRCNLNEYMSANQDSVYVLTSLDAMANRLIMETTNAVQRAFHS